LWNSYLSNFPCWVIACLTAALVRRGLGDARPAVEVLVAGAMGMGAGLLTALGLPRPRAALTFTYHAIHSSIKDMRLRHT
jgi:hypothetical protein